MARTSSNLSLGPGLYFLSPPEKKGPAMKNGYYEEKLLELLDLSIRREEQISAALDAIRRTLERSGCEKSDSPDNQDCSM